MDLSELKMTLNAYQKVSKSILGQYVTKEELELELDEYVKEVTPEEQASVGENGVFARKRKQWVRGVEEAPADGIAYARQDNQWVEVDLTYKRPRITEFVLIGLQDEYPVGDTVRVTGLIHQETNIKHIQDEKLYLYRDDELLLEVDATEEARAIPFVDEFEIRKNVNYRLEFEADIGNIYYVDKDVIAYQTSYMRSGESSLSIMTEPALAELPEMDFEEEKKYRYRLNQADYIWWCTNFEIDSVKQDGLYPIDIVKQAGTIKLDDVDFYCYRTKTKLVAGNWAFVIVPKGEEPPATKNDLRMGGSVNKVMTFEELSEDLMKKDFVEGQEYRINLSANAYVWWCMPYECEILDGSGNPVDYIQQEGTIRCDGYDFICYRSKYVLVPDTWRFKFEKL